MRWAPLLLQRSLNIGVKWTPLSIPFEQNLITIAINVSLTVFWSHLWPSDYAKNSPKSLICV